MNEKYYYLIQLNAFENLIVRLGDGLRYTFLAYKKLKLNEKLDLNISEDLLYEILTDFSTFTNKKSLNHFYTYIVSYLLTSECPDIDKDDFSTSLLSSYTCLDEYIYSKSKVSIEAFKFFYFELWDKLVEAALINLNDKEAIYDLKIPFKKFVKFYPNIPLTTKHYEEEICAKFLSDFEDFLMYNHIVKLKDFDIDESTNDLTIPIQFKFSYLDKY